jgi:hypothetical protein
MTVHLTRAYRRRGPGEEPAGSRFPSVPVAACSSPDGEQADIYPDGDGEDRIDCPDCLAWLAEGDNRLLILDVNEWIRRRVAAGGDDVYYIDVPMEEG